MRKVSDGWHKVYGWDVYIEDGRVLRGVSEDRQTTIYPYKWNRFYGWVNVGGVITIDAFRSGLYRDTVMMK